MFSRRPKPSQTRRPVGNVSRQNFGYYNTGARLPAPKPRKQRSWQWLRQLPSILAGSLIILSIIYMTTLSSDPVVSFDQSLANKPIKSSQYYHQQLTEVLKASLFNSNKLTINTTKVENDIRSRLPEINDLSVKIPLVGRRPIIVLDPAKPEFKLHAENGSSFIMDTTGRTIASAQDTPVGQGLITLRDQSGLDINIGQQVLPGKSVDFITTFVKELKGKSVTVSELVLPRIANQLNISIKKQNYIIKVNLDGDARLQAGTYLAVAHYLAKKNLLPKQYIDVRVEQRAFYK